MNDDAVNVDAVSPSASLLTTTTTPGSPVNNHPTVTPSTGAAVVTQPTQPDIACETPAAWISDPFTSPEIPSPEHISLRSLVSQAEIRGSDPCTEAIYKAKAKPVKTNHETVLLQSDSVFSFLRDSIVQRIAALPANSPASTSIDPKVTTKQCHSYFKVTWSQQSDTATTSKQLSAAAASTSAPSGPKQRIHRPFHVKQFPLVDWNRPLSHLLDPGVKWKK
jgi:hypothetical protein